MTSSDMIICQDIDGNDFQLEVMFPDMVIQSPYLMKSMDDMDEF